MKTKIKNEKLTTQNWWEAARAADPTFSQVAPEWSQEFATASGYTMLANMPGTDGKENLINSFIRTSAKIYFLDTKRSFIKDPTEGIVEVYDVPMGDVVQRTSVLPFKGISSVVKKEYPDGAIVSPFIVRNVEVRQRLFKLNRDFANVIELPSTEEVKIGFITDQWAGVLSEIYNRNQQAYELFRYTMRKEAINAYLNDTTVPMQETQKLSIGASTNKVSELTDDDLKNASIALTAVRSAMDAAVTTSEYNSYQHESAINASNFMVFARPGLVDALRQKVLPNIFHPEDLQFTFTPKTLQDFGGIYMVNDSGTRLYEVYDDLGIMIGYNTQKGLTGKENVQYTEDQVTKVDPNEDVLMVIMEKGTLFEGEQNPLHVETIWNPRRQRSVMWTNQINSGTWADAAYNVIVITK